MPILELINKATVLFPVCNKRPERAPHIFGRPFILCWRCTGILIGAVCIYLLIRLVPIFLSVKIFVLGLIGLIPMICDGIMQYGYGKISNNYRRFITGLLFGAGAVCTIGFTVNNIVDIEHHSVFVSSIVSVIGFLFTFYCIRWELQKTLKEKLIDQQRKIYADCYRKISVLKRKPEIVFDRVFYESVLECGSELSLSASKEVISAFVEIERIALDGYERYRDFIAENDPHGNSGNYEVLLHDEEEIEVYHGTEMDDRIFETKVATYVSENTPSCDTISEKLSNLLNMMRVDIGNHVIQ